MISLVSQTCLISHILNYILYIYIDLATAEVSSVNIQLSRGRDERSRMSVRISVGVVTHKK